MAATDALIPEAQAEALKSTVFDALKDSTKLETETEEEFETRKEQQAEIIGTLTEESLSKLQTNMELHRDRVGRFPEKDDRDRFLRGYTFEMLVKPQHDKLQQEAGRSLFKSRAGEQLLEILRTPPPELVYTMRHLRNPDFIDLEESDEGDRIVIKSIAEVKLGKLNYRAYEQLSDFKDNLNTALKSLRERDDLESLGYAELAQNIKKLRVASEPEQIVYMSADKELNELWTYTDDKDFVNHMTKERDVYAWDEFVELLNGCELRQSPFSAEEVAKISASVSQHLTL